MGEKCPCMPVDFIDLARYPGFNFFLLVGRLFGKKALVYSRTLLPKRIRDVHRTPLSPFSLLFVSR